MIKRSISVILCLILFISGSSISFADSEVDLKSFETVGETVYFGRYEIDNDQSNGKEPIPWIVLDVFDGKCLLFSAMGLAVQPFDKDGKTNIWKNCSLRKWLNSEFVNEAFSVNQRKLILDTEVDNSASQDYSYWSNGGSENTIDKVYILSYQEYLRYDPRINDSPSVIFDPNMKESKNYYRWTRSPAIQPNCANDTSIYPANVSCYRVIFPVIVLDLQKLRTSPSLLESPNRPTNTPVLDGSKEYELYFGAYVDKTAPILKYVDGLVAYYVDKDSPAGKAGLYSGKGILAIGPYEVKTKEDFKEALSHFKLGDTTTITIPWAPQKDLEITFDQVIEVPKAKGSTEQTTVNGNDALIWGQEYTCGDFTYSFVQEDALSYYSLRGKDANAIVNAVNANVIPNTERINAKIQDIMKASNYEPTAGEINGVQTEVYGSEESDAFIMATYGDWGVNMMLFVDGATGIADYYSGTIKTEAELQEPPAGNSVLGSAMQSAAEDSGTVKQFNLTAKEYIDAFNKRYATFGMTLEADQKRDDCWFIINGENTDIRIQFCDKVNGPWTTGSGLDMEKWNWLYAYIDTDDYECDIKYFASWPMFCSFLASIVDCEFTQEEFMENCKASGPDEFPVLTYLKDGIKNQIQFRDASVGNYHQTVYSASVEIIQ